MSEMTPREIVHELDRHIIGQADAKRAVAVALRNRWRRMQLSEEMRHEVTPKNILMIGPTGVGKTEIARRLARLANAPFIKIEATKFTEVGYVGRDVDTIIRDLVEIAIKSHREQATRKVRDRAMDAAEDRVLDILLPPARPTVGFGSDAAPEDNATRQKFRKKLREGELDDKEIELELAQPAPTMEILGPPGMEDMAEQLKGLFAQAGGQRGGVLGRDLHVHAFAAPHAGRPRGIRTAHLHVATVEVHLALLLLGGQDVGRVARVRIAGVAGDHAADLVLRVDLMAHGDALGAR